MAYKGGDVGQQIADILDDYTEEVRKTAQDVIYAVANETAEKVADLSPYNPYGGGRKGHYKSGWKVKKIKAGLLIDYVVYNAKKPTLTHLLENGWVMRNGDRHPGVPHISKGEEWANSVIVARIEAKL